MKSYNPYTDTLEKEFTPHTSEQVESIIQKAHEAYETWKYSSFKERKKLMLNLSKILKNAPMDIAKLPTIEMGRLLKHTVEWELPMCGDIASYYADNGEKFMASKTIKWSMLSGNTVVQKEPLGVLFGIMPWNYPFYQVLRFAIPNIMAGNTVVVKHASNVPQCAIAIEQMFHEAGFPKGVYTNILISGRNTGQIIAHPLIKGVSFTGSEGAGSKVAEQAGKHLKKVVLELGGSDPFIVLDDAEISYATDLAVLGRFFNSGQTCIASKRFIVHSAVYDDFLKQFVSKSSALVPADPMDTSTNYAPMSSQKEVDNLLTIIQDAVDKGATLELGGHSYEQETGAWLAPTILSGVTSDMRAYHEELFGPVAVVYKVDTDEEAVALANDSAYGLAAVVVGDNDNRVDSISDRLEAGMIFKNTISITEPDLPFGGVKNSGFGRELGTYGMEEFVNHKIVRKIPIWAFKTQLGNF